MVLVLVVVQLVVEVVVVVGVGLLAVVVQVVFDFGHKIVQNHERRTKEYYLEQ